MMRKWWLLVWMFLGWWLFAGSGQAVAAASDDLLQSSYNVAEGGVILDPPTHIYTPRGKDVSVMFVETFSLAEPMTDWEKFRYDLTVGEGSPPATFTNGEFKFPGNVSEFTEEHQDYTYNLTITDSNTQGKISRTIKISILKETEYPKDMKWPGEGGLFLFRYYVPIYYVDGQGRVFSPPISLMSEPKETGSYNLPPSGNYNRHNPFDLTRRRVTIKLTDKENQSFPSFFTMGGFEDITVTGQRPIQVEPAHFYEVPSGGFLMFKWWIDRNPEKNTFTINARPVIETQPVYSINPQAESELEMALEILYYVPGKTAYQLVLSSNHFKFHVLSPPNPFSTTDGTFSAFIDLHDLFFAPQQLAFPWPNFQVDIPGPWRLDVSLTPFENEQHQRLPVTVFLPPTFTQVAVRPGESGSLTGSGSADIAMNAAYLQIAQTNLISNGQYNGTITATVVSGPVAQSGD